MKDEEKAGDPPVTQTETTDEAQGGTPVAGGAATDGDPATSAETQGDPPAA